MAQSSQSVPTVAANIGGTNHQVNLRDYLNIRIAPFLKKAITESLDAAPHYPLQWLGEHLIHQSMLYEGNPDATKICERFLYKIQDQATSQPPPSSTSDSSMQIHSTSAAPDSSRDPAPAVDMPTTTGSTPLEESSMANHINGNTEPTSIQHDDEPKDTEMADTS